jgi:hypothetical protein
MKKGRPANWGMIKGLKLLIHPSLWKMMNCGTMTTW